MQLEEVIVSASSICNLLSMHGSLMFARIERIENKKFAYLLLCAASGDDTARRHQLTIVQPNSISLYYMVVTTLTHCNKISSVSTLF
jgi:hypothetical protein